MKTLASFVLAFFVGCGVEPPQAVGTSDQPVFCGVSFCLAGVEPEKVMKSTPVEDFNWYKIEMTIGILEIYEGNSPDIGELQRTPVRELKSVRAWSLSPSNNPAVLVEGRSGWPTQLVFYLSGDKVSTTDLVHILKGLTLS